MEELNMEQIKKVKCKNCGFINIKGTITCSRCHANIDTERKSCPRCGKVNSNNVKKCVNCRYDFTKKRKSIWFNLFLTSLIVGIMIVLVYFGKENWVDKFSLGLKVIAGFFLFSIVVNIFTYGSRDVINYSAEEEMIDKHKKFEKMKRFSTVAIVIGAVLVVGFLIFYYVIR